MVHFGVNFTNILCAAFTLKDPQSAYKYIQTVSLFVLLGSAHVKASHVGEIDPWSAKPKVKNGPQCKKLCIMTCISF